MARVVVPGAAVRAADHQLAPLRGLVVEPVRRSVAGPVAGPAFWGVIGVIGFAVSGGPGGAGWFGAGSPGVTPSSSSSPAVGIR